METLINFRKKINYFLTTINEKICKHHYALLIIIIYILIMSIISIFRLHIFVDNWDLGTFSQSLWSATKRKLFLDTCDCFFSKDFPRKLTISFLAIHFSPILILLVPFYWIYPKPSTLLVLQSIWMGLGGLPTYLLAYKIFNRRVALFFLISYFINPLTIAINLNSFHIESLLVPLLSFAMYYAVVDDRKKYLVTTILASLIMEYSSILVLFINIYYIICHRKNVSKRFILWLVIYSGLLIGYALLAYNIRILFGLDPHGLTKSISSHAWQVLGATSPLNVPIAAITHPLRCIRALFTDWQSKLLWIFTVIAPVLGLPLLYPLGLLPALPWLSLSLLSNYPPYYALNFKASFFFFTIYHSSILGLKKLLYDTTLTLKKEKVPIAVNGRLIKRSAASSTIFHKRFLTFLLVLMIIVSAEHGILSMESRIPSISLTHASIIHKMINLIPENASVLTTSNIFPYLANRLNVYMIPPPSMRPDYRQIAITILNNINPEFVLIDILSPYSRIREQSYFILKNFIKVKETEYGIFAFEDGILLFKKGYKKIPVLYQQVIKITPDKLRVPSNLYSTITNIDGDEVLQIAVKEPTKTIWFGPYEFIPKGNYTVKIKLIIKVEETVLQPTQQLMTIDIVCNSASRRLALTQISLSNLTANNTITLELPLHIDNNVFDLEIRGRYASTPMTIYVFPIEIKYCGETL